MIGFAKKKKPEAPLPVSALEFREIRDDAPRAVKELLIKREGVHPFTQSDKLHELESNRMAPAIDGTTIWDKHCYGLFAPGEETPRIAVYVKLLHIAPDADGNIPSDQLPGNIQEILSQPTQAVAQPNTAIFYTITSLAGAAAKEAKPDKQPKKLARAAQGYTAGEQLIRHVANHLSQAYGIEAFSTLSPLRAGTGERAVGFAQWLQARLLAAAPSGVLTAAEERDLRSFVQAGADMSNYDALQALTARQSALPPGQQQFLSGLMKDLANYYLAHEKSKHGGVLPFDKVANFHIGNGAEIANIHWLPGASATVSETIGAAGMMVNYRYYPQQLDTRKLRFAERAVVRQSPPLAEHYAMRMKELTIPQPSIDLATLERFGQVVPMRARDTANVAVALQ